MVSYSPQRSKKKNEKLRVDGNTRFNDSTKRERNVDLSQDQSEGRRGGGGQFKEQKPNERRLGFRVVSQRLNGLKKKKQKK